PLTGDAPAASWDSTLLTYIATYLKAYFRGGRFLVLDATARQKVEKALETRYPFLARKQLEELFPELLKASTLFGDVGSEGFVTRAGASYQFRTIGARLDPVASRASHATEVELPVVAADVARVVLEAIFDAHDRLPAVSAATGTSIDAAHNGLKVHDPADSPVNADEFAEVNRHANQ